MKSHFELSDSAFKRQFENSVFKPSLFSHEAHIRLAWILIRQYGIEEAIIRIKGQLKQFVKHLGAEGKYNETLTIAATKAVHHFISKSKADTFKDFIEEYPRLKTHFKDLMRCHYGFDIYHSQKAKETYLEPDLLPFT